MSFSRYLKLLPDKPYLQLMYYYHFHRFANLKNPRTFNEKLQWLKLYDHRPEYITMVDKVAVKEYVGQRIGFDHIIPTLGTWNSLNDVCFDLLPDQFVLKWNHDSGSIVICKDKNDFDQESAIKKLKSGENLNGFWYGREWPYKGVRPMLLAEKYMEDSLTGELRDYKVFTFNGRAELFLVTSDRQKKGEEVKFDFFDRQKKHLDIVNKHPNASKQPELPQSFDEIITMAEKLSKGYRHMRVDFYDVNGHIFFGEITLYHGSGFMSFSPDYWNEKMGEMIKL